MPSARTPAGCAFNRGVSGALGGATAFLRVTRTGDALAGAYFYAYLMFQGPVISYAALLREGLLKPDFAEAALWASTAPAARGASPCVSVWQPE